LKAQTKVESEELQGMNHSIKRKIFNCHHWVSALAVTMALALGISAGAQQVEEKAKLVSDKDAKDAKEAAPAATEPKADPEPKAEYVIGDGDVLHIDVWQEPEVSQNVTVRPDGNISLPLINEIKVGGMTPLQIQSLVADKLKSFVNQPKVTVTVTEVHSRKAFITGEVTRPGEYPLNTQVTVLQLIAQAGGFTPFAKTESVMILRIDNGKELRLKFKYREVLHGKNTEQNIALQPGDTVVVP
jgi:polysaccharide biosynthesis/export protein